MAAAASTSGSCVDHKRTLDDAFLTKMKLLVEKLRLENATLKKSLCLERSEVRALKAKHEGALRTLKTEHKKKEDNLEKQIRIATKIDKDDTSNSANHKLIELKKLATEIQSLKADNKCLQEKLKVAQAAECARAAELRAHLASYAAQEQAAQRDARAQCHQLLEEIKSKERVIMHMKKEIARTSATQITEQVHRMECGVTELAKKLRVEQGRENNNREDLKTDIQHRKETFYREGQSDADSAMSSAPASLSPQPLGDMWSCAQCRTAADRESAAAREAARLSDALRDAREQIELMEFRILELEDARSDKGTRETLTDSDSGCVSPGSRIKDSASPELKRMDSGYKSPHTPSSPMNSRRVLGTPHDDFKEDFAKAQVLADILDRNSETSDSLRSNPVKEHLEQMILNAASAEDRSCLEQVLMLLYNLQTLSSSVSEDEFYQAKPKRICDLKAKLETDIPSLKTQKAIATVTPYQQKGYKCESLESLCEERKPSSVLQESGIFEGVETESTGTQTDGNESFECSSELNTEIQRLNSIRQKLERQSKTRTLTNKDSDADGLECRCVKLGKKHKQYYERRLKFLEGKISIYEAAPDVKEAKLAERLQKEFIIENRVQDLENQLLELQDKYERLEEECCELEEIENDTRLHWQQLEIDYELCSAQLRDMTEQRECSRAQAESLLHRLNKKEIELRNREIELTTRLSSLERAVPALIAWNVAHALGLDLPSKGKELMITRLGPYKYASTSELVKRKDRPIAPTPAWDDLLPDPPVPVQKLETMVSSLISEKHSIESQRDAVTSKLKARIKDLEEKLDVANRQLCAIECGAEVSIEKVEKKIEELEERIQLKKADISTPVDPSTANKIKDMMKKEKELKSKIAELERREAAYLEMLSQADDMWAEMEGGYKKRIETAHAMENKLKKKLFTLEEERDEYKNTLLPVKKKLAELEEIETDLKIALEKAQKDTKTLTEKNKSLKKMYEKADAETKKVLNDFKQAEEAFKKEQEEMRRVNKVMDTKMRFTVETARDKEKSLADELANARKSLQRMNKNCQELEVTNGELREEVESLEKQLSLTQKALSQCKRKCDEKIKNISHELSIKTEELEELRSETMRQTFHASRVDLQPDKTEYIDEGYSIYTAVPKKTDIGRMHHSMSYITDEAQCSCPSMRSQLVSQLIDDLFDRMHNTVDDDLTRLCQDLPPDVSEVTAETKAKIMNYLLMAISKELVRSIGDADAKTDTEEWRRLARRDAAAGAARRLAGNAGVLRGAARLASVSCACAAARLAHARPRLAPAVKDTQQEVLDHGDVKVMEEQLANAIESIVNCPCCALGTNAIVWSTDV